MSPPFRSNISQLRRPIVVTMSLAVLTPCCKGNGQGAQPPDNSAIVSSSAPATSSAPVTTSTAGAAAGPTAPTTTANTPPAVASYTKVWPFERDATVQNPRAGDKVVVFNGSTCSVLGDEDERTSGIQFARHPVACPEGIGSLLKNCYGGFLHLRGDTCECSTVEGNPPMPPRPVDCPSR